MAQLALATAGAAVGNFILPGIGGQFGWALGSFAGAALFPPKQVNRQPIADTRYLDSSYGNPIDIHFGVIPVTRANVIWASDFRPIPRTESVGGKGQPEVENTTYTYEIDIAIALSDRECVGLGRIKVDNVVKYDGRTAGGAQAVIAGGGFFERIAGSLVEQIIEGQEWCDTCTFYPGSEDQLPDPTIEAAEGVGMVPAYRGTCYVVIKGLKCGGAPRVPQLEIELFADGIYALRGVLWSNTAASPEFVRHGIVTVTDKSVIDVTKSDNFGVVETTQRFSLVDGSQLAAGASFPFPPVIGTLGEGVLVFRTKPLYCHPTRADQTSCYVQLQSYDATFGWNLGGIDYTDLFLDGHNTIVGVIGSADERHAIAFYRDDAAALNTPLEWTVIDTSTWTVAEDPEDPSRGWRGTTAVSVGAPNGLTRYTTGLNNQTSAVGCMESDLRHIWVVGETGVDVYLQVLEYDEDTDSWELVAADAELYPLQYTGVSDAGGGQTSTSIWADDGLCVIAAGTTKIGLGTRYDGLTASSPTVASVLSHLYGRTGYSSAADLNVSVLTQQVAGFEFSTPAAPRAAFEALGAAYLCDFVESDGKIKGVNRGGAVAAELSVDDLGASESLEFTPLLDIDRQHESEIPYKVTVRYISSGGDYKRGAQHAENAVTSSNEQTTLDLPIVLTDSRAAQLADIIRRARWRARSPIKFGTWAKFLKLEPTDIVDVSDGTQTRRVMLTAMRQRGLLLECESVSEGAASYTSNATAGSVPPGQSIQTPAAVLLQMLDIPALRDDHDGWGINAAGAGLLGSFYGAGLFRSSDDNAYSNVGVIESAATIGFTEGALGNYTGPFFTDEGNTVVVGVMPGQTLSSITDAELLNGGNLCAISAGDGEWELLCFRTATLLSTGRYRLSGLVRGLYGTEHLMADHAARDAFVMLSTSTAVRVPMAPLDFLQARYWKAPAPGRSVADVTATQQTFRAVSLRPLAPVGLRATPNAMSGITLEWIRRVRLDGIPRDYWSDAPLDEAAEAYEVDIYAADNTTLLRTIEVSGATSVDYTAAQIAEDFDDPGAIGTLNWRVAQMSSTTIARGTEAIGATPVSFGSVIAYLKFNGTNGSTTLTEESGKSTWTAGGAAALSTTSPIGGSASLRLNGSGNDRISTPATALWDLGSGDWTLELHYERLGTHQTNARVFQTRDADLIAGISLFIGTTTSQDNLSLGLSTDGGLSFNAANQTVGTLPTLGAGPAHIEMSRQGTIVRVFIGGTLSATITGVTGPIFYDATHTIVAGGQSGTSRSLNARVDRFKFTKGAALHTGNFTPPAAE